MTTVTSVVPAAPEAAPPDAGAALAAGKQRKGSGPVPLVAQLVAVGLIGLGVVGVQETLVRSGLVNARSWISATLDWLDGTDHRAPWVLVVGVLAVIVGLQVLRIGLRPRPRLTLTVAAQTGVQLRPQDLARLVRTASADVGGIDRVDVRATQRRLTVVVHSIAAKERDAEVRELVTQRLEPVLASLARRPRLNLSVRHEEA